MNILLINILVGLFCLILGYVFGSIPTAVWVGKIFYHQDPRDYGSHNAGGTNAGRLWGKKVGFCVIMLDMLKTIAPLYICWAILTFAKFDYSGIQSDNALLFGNNPLIADVKTYYTEANKLYAIVWPIYWLAPLGCMIGHCWPIFAGFKGGKGVSCYMGTLCGTTWMLGVVPGLFYFLILKWKKYVSLASILVSILGAVFAWTWSILCMTGVIPHDLLKLPSYGPNLNLNFVYASVVTVMSIVLIIRHRANIARIKAGTERKISWMK